MGKNILIVDDKKLLRDALIDYLEDDNYEFIEAENGEKGIQIFRQQQIDLVILDQMLPGIDGIRTLQLMKKIKPSCPIIGLTGELSVEIREQYLKAGAFDVHAKSAIYEKLVPTIKDALSGKQPEKTDFEQIDYDEMAESLKKDGRWEESALYLKEAGIEQKALGDTKKAIEYFKEAMARYERAGRTSKAQEVELLFDE